MKPEPVEVATAPDTRPDTLERWGWIARARAAAQRASEAPFQAEDPERTWSKAHVPPAG